MSDVPYARPHGPRPAKISHRDLFLAFARIGLLGFGGVTPWLRRVLVEEYAWLDDREFAELFGFTSALPGANTVSIAVILGDRNQGIGGSLAAVTGLLAMPLIILVGIAILYDQSARLPDVQNAIGGAAAATAGLVIGNGIKMTRNMKPDVFAYGTGLCVFILAGLMHMPLLSMLLIIVPASVTIGMLRSRLR